MSQKIVVQASGELGYVMTYLNTLDGLPVKPAHEANGVVVALGGGGEWMLWDKIGVGPKVVAAFGSITAIQVLCGATFMF